MYRGAFNHPFRMRTPRTGPGAPPRQACRAAAAIRHPHLEAPSGSLLPPGASNAGPVNRRCSRRRSRCWPGRARSGQTHQRRRVNHPSFRIELRRPARRRQCRESWFVASMAASMQHHRLPVIESRMAAAYLAGSSSQLQRPVGGLDAAPARLSRRLLVGLALRAVGRRTLSAVLEDRRGPAGLGR